MTLLFRKRSLTLSVEGSRTAKNLCDGPNLAHHFYEMGWRSLSYEYEYE